MVLCIVAFQFETDGDFSVDVEKTGLVKVEDYTYRGVFLCSCAGDIQSLIRRVQSGVTSHDPGMMEYLTSMFEDAYKSARNDDTIKEGFFHCIEGNYNGTFVYVNPVKDTFAWSEIILKECSRQLQAIKTCVRKGVSCIDGIDLFQYAALNQSMVEVSNVIKSIFCMGGDEPDEKRS